MNYLVNFPFSEAFLVEVKFLDHFKEEIQIRIDNKQNKLRFFNYYL